MHFEQMQPLSKSDIDFLNTTNQMEYDDIKPMNYGWSDPSHFSPIVKSKPTKIQTEEPSRYIHRCPFTHCPHNPENEQQCMPQGIKIPLLTMQQDNWHPKIKRNDLRQGHYISRGTVDLKVTTKDRSKAIAYMLSRMGLDESLDPKLHNQLRLSVSTLERQVFKNSESKEKYIENLAKKLFLIFQELECRQNHTSEHSATP